MDLGASRITLNGEDLGEVKDARFTLSDRGRSCGKAQALVVSRDAWEAAVSMGANRNFAVVFQKEVEISMDLMPDDPASVRPSGRFRPNKQLPLTPTMKQKIRRIGDKEYRVRKKKSR